MREFAAQIAFGEVELPADVAMPDHSGALVLFAHGSGSSRHSPRNQFVARALNEAGISTVLADLLTAEEEAIDVRTAHLRFDIALLARRMVALTDWIGAQTDLKKLALGYFGASTGAAAALVAAAERPSIVRAVVSRGGRPDLAASDLNRVLAPVLLTVGSLDTEVLALNRAAMAKLRPETERKLEIVPGASHLFEEPGALERVAELARNWFRDHLV